jgi:uridine phosphorylase
MLRFLNTDLITNPDGSVYHLKLLPNDIAGTIITVGDPSRVAEVSRHFDRLEVEKSNREFITHTGWLGNKRLTVISTGIGTGNIDIVLNELDALVNIDLESQTVKEKLTSLNIIRIGTSGALQPDVPVDSLLVSSHAIGLDSLMHYYNTAVTADALNLLNAFNENTTSWPGLNPYITLASPLLMNTLGKEFLSGITLTAPGFYAPQGRILRGDSTFPDLLKKVIEMDICGRKITNMEMETAAIYGLAANLGHQAISFNVIMANRSNDQFSADPAKSMGKAIQLLLERIVQSSEHH